MIAIARDTFLREILPALPPALRTSGLMVASALAIAERSLGLPRSGILDAAPLVHAIRAGRHDGDRTLHAELLEDARIRVAVANPRYLGR
ncbi:MAG: hypothetical protein FJX57_22665 [Alphaproteobacteria bacterium]|nr:hypothetical protein [Alphaproteobacteria bacterium]